MKLTESLVSTVVLASNAETSLARCLESLLVSSHSNLDVIVIDDGSRDKTHAIANVYKKIDGRIRVYKNKKRYGPAISFNRGLKRAKGQFISFMNAQDSISNLKIQKQVTLLQKQPKVVAVGTQAKLTDEKGKKIDQSNFPVDHDSIYQAMLHGIPMRFESALINRTLLPKDLIKFTTNTYPFIYKGVFMRMMQYGKLTNLSYTLYTHSLVAKATYHLQRKPAFMASFASQLLQSMYDHDYRPSVRALLQTSISALKDIPLPRLIPPFRSA